MSPPPAIAARGLEKRFGRARALRGLDLVLAAGHCLAVLGPNGAGKSTLLRLMAGLARPSGGELRIAGRPATGREARARIGLVAEASFLYPQLTARENLLFAARLHRVPEAASKLGGWLAREQLEEVAERPAGALSRGMARRLAIARALVHEPEIVLLDEPFSGLDRAGAERLMRRLSGLRQAGRTLVLVTHDFGRAAALGDSQLVLVDGRVAHRGEASDAATLERAYADRVAATA